MEIKDEVYDGDALSSDLRSPPYPDGTPHESVADVLVRVTQLMSILETQNFNEIIVTVAPDSDNLSVLEAGLTGLDLRSHRQLAYDLGEVRFVDATKLPPPRQAASAILSALKNLQTAEAHPVKKFPSLQTLQLLNLPLVRAGRVVPRN